jgi:hypothetical protein
LGIECIATFDSDFDSIAWLKKLSSSNDITWPLKFSKPNNTIFSFLNF